MHYRDKSKYEQSEKFRAETFRFAGYAFCTPLGLNILTLLSKDSLIALEQPWLPGILVGSLVFAIAGFFIIVESYSIMLRSDRRVFQ